MGNITRVRVELDLRHPDRAKATRLMLKWFKTLCRANGIADDYRQCQAFESEPDRRKRKAKRSLVRNAKEALRALDRSQNA